MENNLFKPLVSIIIPVYNGSNYMREAIDSALAQTYENIEILVINDGSTDEDGTDAIAKSYGKKIRYFKKKNGGVASALNIGIKEMKGEYFSWLSHDDIYLKDKIQKQIGQLDILGNKDTILYGDYDLVDGNLNLMYRVAMNNMHELRNLNYGMYAVINGTLNGCTMLIPRKILVDIGGFKPELKFTQDYDCWFRIFLKEYDIRYMNETFLLSRFHDAQDSKRSESRTECSALWIGIYNEILCGNFEKLGNKLDLLKKAEKMFTELGYTAAIDFVKNEKGKIIVDYWDKHNKSPLVSYVLTCFNQGNYIVKAVESCLNNGYKNIEVIIVDDGSYDKKTLKILDEIENDDKVSVIHMQNSGVSCARNVGILKAKGEFVQLLDGDDFLLSGKIEKQLDAFAANIENDISYCKYCYYNETTNEFIEPDVKSLLLNDDKQFESFLLNWQIPLSIPIHCFLFRRECFDGNLFYEGLDVCEDYLMWLHLAYVRRRYNYLDFKGCVYRLHDDSYMHHTNKLDILKDVIDSLKYIKSKYVDSDYECYFEKKKIEYIRNIVLNADNNCEDDKRDRENLRKQIATLQETNKQEIENLRKQLVTMQQTKGWKMLEKFRSVRDVLKKNKRI